MVVVDTHLARGASNGGRTFHDRGGPYGRTDGAKRVVAVDVTGLPLAAQVVPASTPEAKTVELLLEGVARTAQDERLELVLVDRGSSEKASARFCRRGIGWRCAGSAGTSPSSTRTAARCFSPSGSPGGRGRPWPARPTPPSGPVVRELGANIKPVTVTAAAV